MAGIEASRTASLATQHQMPIALKLDEVLEASPPGSQVGHCFRSDAVRYFAPASVPAIEGKGRCAHRVGFIEVIGGRRGEVDERSLADSRSSPKPSNAMARVMWEARRG